MAPPSNLCSHPSPASLLISASGVFLLCLRHYRRTRLVLSGDVSLAMAQIISSLGSPRTYL